MKNRFLSLAGFAILVVLPAVALAATYQVLHGTVGSGGGARAGGGYVCWDTAGEPAIGIVSGASNTVKAGFWHCAVMTSTVDVAFTSLLGELRDDAVVLSWSTSATSSFEGFNVYRSEGSSEADAEFTRLNDSLLPPERGGSYTDALALAGRTYLYRVGAVSGDREWRSPSISLALPPKPTSLYQNFPNPFNPSTSIAFYLANPGHVSLAIYDAAGARVRALFDAPKPAGRHTVTWDGRNDSGASVGSGVYYYRLTAGKASFVKKLVVVR